MNLIRRKNYLFKENIVFRIISFVVREERILAKARSSTSVRLAWDFMVYRLL